SQQIVIVLFLSYFSTELEAMIASHPAHGIAKLVGILRLKGGSGLALRSPEADAVKRQALDLDARDLEIRISCGFELVRSKARQVGSRFVEQGAGDDARVDDRDRGVHGSKREVLH